MRWVFATLVACAATGAQAEDVNRASICSDLSRDYVEKHEKGRDHRLYRVFELYSAKIDACIHVEAKIFGTGVEVRDLTNVVFANQRNMLLECDVRGIDEVDIEVVRTHRGNVSDVPDKDWLTDGQGGQPKSLKESETPLARIDCELALERWLSKWSG